MDDAGSSYWWPDRCYKTEPRCLYGVGAFRHFYSEAGIHHLDKFNQFLIGLTLTFAANHWVRANETRMNCDNSNAKNAFAALYG